MLAQHGYDDISYDRIPYKKIRKYIEEQRRLYQAEHLSEIEASCAGQTNFDGFQSYTKTYRVKAKIEDVWTTYVGASPTESWKTRKSAVGLVYDKTGDQFFYTEDHCDGSAIGQVLYLNLRLAKGFYKLATSLEITDIGNEDNTIELSYIEKGVNQGKQWIKMRQTEDGYTEITHTSVIKSDSPFRDKYLYPYFHNKLINAFHKKMRREVEHHQLIASTD